MDGNFKAEHLHPINPDDEVWLSDGFGFMVKLQQPLSCQSSECSSKLESTGIRGVKGERQMNMDYALCEAAAYNMKGITKAVTFYYINCQYNKHFYAQVNQESGFGMCMDIRTAAM
ncbi:uncharacterized protein EDB91DRAFT_1247343 [Suillus paluster]|uniref:uncharacterized protein n=1 Tax=Suillus paluster TaxID=48578 RepID=UPI001B869886|nr:uncharacterized protein EDB91DRAFT_1247343 [Suillus paluster]KAG1743260.1 hypothetical protein EDB91DRAFT_1247343 [Suillus paluster]